MRIAKKIKGGYTILNCKYEYLNNVELLIRNCKIKVNYDKDYDVYYVSRETFNVISYLVNNSVNF